MLLAVAAFAVIGCGSDSPTATEDGATAVAAEPAKAPALRKIRAQANQLLDGGPEAFKAGLGELRGHPGGVNQWASWCGPCRYEFPFLRNQASKYGHRVAFLGVDSKDSREEAEAVLKELPVPYPHYYDKDASIARVFRGGRAWPTTAFYEASGKLVYTHAGTYATESKLEEDVRRCALG